MCRSKCVKWLPGKKSAIGDKAAVRKVDRPLYWEDRLPFAMAPLQTLEDVTKQQERVSGSQCDNPSFFLFFSFLFPLADPYPFQFVQLWESDPVTAEPEDEMVLEA